MKILWVRQTLVPTYKILNDITMLLLTVMSLKRNPGIKGKPSILVLYFINTV